jgi:hypothetical protein
MDLRTVVSDYQGLVQFYRGAVDRQSMLREAAEQWDGEAVLVFVSPFILAIALALRITKVTGELRLGQVD